MAFVSYGGICGWGAGRPTVKGVVTALTMMPIVGSVSPFFAQVIDEEGKVVATEFMEQSADAMLDDLRRVESALGPFARVGSCRRNLSLYARESSVKRCQREIAWRTLTMPDTPTPAEAISFERDIKPLFRDHDRTSMQRAFDLWSYDDVRPHADAILSRLRAGTMPCDGSWPADRTDAFQNGGGNATIGTLLRHVAGSRAGISLGRVLRIRSSARVDRSSRSFGQRCLASHLCPYERLEVLEG